MFSSQDLSSIQKQQHKRDIKMSFNHIQSKLRLYLILWEIPPWLLKRQLLVLQNRTWAENHEIVINVVPEKQTSKIRHGLEPFEKHNTLNNFELASQELSKSSEMMFNISALKLGLNSNCSICQETSIVLVGSSHQA